jgi:lipoprotein-releasing system permease protein
VSVGYGVSVFIDNIPFISESLPTVTTYPINYSPTFYIMGVVFAIISTFLAGYLPARKAQKIDPIEIIRGQ